MYAIVPLQFRPGPETDFWASGPGLERIRTLLCELAGLAEVERVLVLAGEAQETSGMDNATVLSLPPDFSDAEETFDALPMSGARMLETVRAHLPSIRTELVIIDVRNLALNGATLGQALLRWRQSGAPMLVSVYEAVDHPCQFQSHFQVLDAGMVHFFKARQSGDEVTGIRSFLNLSGRLETGLVVRIDLNGFEPKDGRTPCGLFHADLPVPLNSPVFNAVEAVYLGKDGKLCLDFTGRGVQSATHLLVQPFRADGVSLTPKLLPLSPDSSTGLPEIDPTVCDGLVYSLLKASSGGIYDVVYRLTPIQGLWCLDECSFPTRTVDQKKILGRQDFPTVYEVVGGLLAIQADRLPEAMELFESGESIGIDLEGSAIVINSQKDAALAQALLDAKLQG